MFKLVGSEVFHIGTTRCLICIKLLDELIYRYSIEVNGKQLEKFVERQTKILSVWNWSTANLPFRIVLGIYL